MQTACVKVLERASDVVCGTLKISSTNAICVSTLVRTLTLGPDVGVLVSRRLDADARATCVSFCVTFKLRTCKAIDRTFLGLGEVGLEPSDRVIRG